MAAVAIGFNEAPLKPEGKPDGVKADPLPEYLESPFEPLRSRPDSRTAPDVSQEDCANDGPEEPNQRLSQSFLTTSIVVWYSMTG